MVIFVVSYNIINRFYYKKRILSRIRADGKIHQNNKIIESRELIKSISVGKTNKFVNKIRNKLSYSGLEIDVYYFIEKITIVSVVLFCLITIVTRNIIAALIGVCLFGIIIDVILNILNKRRIKKVSGQLLDMVITVSSSLKSGYSLIQSLDRIAEEDIKPLSVEVGFVIRNINIGQSYDEAFGNMIERNPIEDLEILVTGILINKETGGNLSHILDSISETIRERERIQGEVKSLTAQSRLSGGILSLMPICIGGITYMINPSYMAPLLYSSLGRILLISAVTCEVLGILVIKKITKIDW
jgi:tight adherence protein B